MLVLTNTAIASEGIASVASKLSIATKQQAKLLAEALNLTKLYTPIIIKR